MSAWQKHSEHICPICGVQMEASQANPRLGYNVILWCANGKCESKQANEGAYGDNEAEAYEVLCDLINQEQRRW